MASWKSEKICQNCGERAGNLSTINKQKYWSRLCRDCFAEISGDVKKASSGHANYNRRRDAEDHQWEIVQPYTSDGKPSRDFIGLYPDRAKSLFSEDELRKYG